MNLSLSLGCVRQSVILAVGLLWPLSDLAFPNAAWGQDEPEGFTWRGEAVPNDAGASSPLSGPWTGSGSVTNPEHLIGRVEITTIDPEQGLIVVTYGTPQDGDSVGFGGPDIFYRPFGGQRSVSLAGLAVAWDTVGFAMRDAIFSGGVVNANSISISNPDESVDFSASPNQMTFNNTELLADIVSMTAGELMLNAPLSGQVNPDTDITFNGGQILAAEELEIGGHHTVLASQNPNGIENGEVEFNGTQVDSLKTLEITSGGIDESRFGELITRFEAAKSDVKQDVLLNTNEHGKVNLEIDGASEISWASDSGGATTQLGVFGDASITIKGGSKVNTNDTIVALGDQVKTTIEVDGAEWKLGETSANVSSIGGMGQAEVTAKNGASIISGSVSIGLLNTDEDEISRVTLNDTSTLTVHGFLEIAQSGQAELNIKDQSTVEVDGLVVMANQEDSMAKVLVESGNTFKTASTFEVGREGTAELNIHESGVVESEGDFFVGTRNNGVGTVKIDGADSTLDLKGHLNLGNGVGAGSPGSFNGRGQMNVQNGGELKIAGGKEIRVGRRENSEGQLVLAGADSKITIDGGGSTKLIVGLDGTGSMAVQDGFSSGSDELDFTIGQGVKGNGSALVAGEGTKLTAATVIVGDEGKGMLTLRDGAKLRVEGDEFILGNKKDSQGTLRLDGAGQSEASIEGEPRLFIGKEGTGTLELTNAATFTQASEFMLGEMEGSTANVTVRGAGSTFTAKDDVRLAEEGKVNVRLEDGGQFVAEKLLLLGDQLKGEATITITGSSPLVGESKLTYNELRLGPLGVGTINVEDGGQLIGSNGATAVSLGALPSDSRAIGTVNLKGKDSFWFVNNSQGLNIGEFGTGAVNLEDGAQLELLEFSELIIGKDGTGKGTLTIKGEVTGESGFPTPTQVTVGRTLYVGKDGEGELRIDDGGALKRAVPIAGVASTIVGEGISSSGKVVVTDKGSVLESGILEVGSTFSARPIRAEVLVENGGLIRADAVLVGRDPNVPGASIDITGKAVLTSGTSVSTLEFERLLNIQGAGRVTVSDEGILQSRTGITGGEASISIGDWNGLASGVSDATLEARSGGQILFDGDNFDIDDGGIVLLSDAKLVSRGTMELNGNSREALLAPELVAQNSLVAVSHLDIENGDVDLLNGSTLDAKTLDVKGDGGFKSLVSVSGSTLDLEDAFVRGSSEVGLSDGSTATLSKNRDLNRLAVSNSDSVWDTLGGATTVGDAANLAEVGQVRVNPGGLVFGSGTIKGDLYLGGGIDKFTGMLTGGRVGPGSSPGTLTIEGDFFAEEGARVELEIAGASDGLFDQLIVGGAATFAPGSIIDFVFIDGFAPQMGESFSFIQAAEGLELDFGEVDFSVHGLLPGFEFMPQVSNGAFSITALNDAMAVPEPTAIALLALAVTGLTGTKRQRPAVCR